MSHNLIVFGAAIFALLGLLHIGLTLRDLRSPRAFTPTTEHVRQAMATAPLRLAPQTTIWRAWLGFNLSHGLGLLLFGGLVGGIALEDPSALPGNTFLRVVAIGGAATYTVLAMRFWFWAPAVAAAAGTLCFIASGLLTYGC